MEYWIVACLSLKLFIENYKDYEGKNYLILKFLV